MQQNLLQLQYLQITSIPVPIKLSQLLLHLEDLLSSLLITFFAKSVHKVRNLDTLVRSMENVVLFWFSSFWSLTLNYTPLLSTFPKKLKRHNPFVCHAWYQLYINILYINILLLMYNAKLWAKIRPDFIGTIITFIYIILILIASEKRQSLNLSLFLW